MWSLLHWNVVSCVFTETIWRYNCRYLFSFWIIAWLIWDLRKNFTERVLNILRKRSLRLNYNRYLALSFFYILLDALNFYRINLFTWSKWLLLTATHFIFLNYKCFFIYYHLLLILLLILCDFPLLFMFSIHPPTLYPPVCLLTVFSTYNQKHRHKMNRYYCTRKKPHKIPVFHFLYKFGETNHCVED